jgi:translocation and assembly module TamB
MSEAPRRRRRRWLAFAAGGALVVGGAIAAVGPAAPWVVDHLADGARVWRLGRIQIDGVSGQWLGALRVERLAIADEDGIWIEARDIALDWSPQNILFGAVRINAVSAHSVAITRRPALLAPRPSGRVRFDVRIDALRAETITLAEDVIGAPAVFAADLAMDLRDKELRALDADLRRLDSDDDRLIAFYRSDEVYALNVDVESAPGGVIVRMLGVPDLTFRARAQGDGDMESGRAQYTAAIGDGELLTGAARWGDGRWTADAQARLDLLPSMAALARRIGRAVTASASGEHAGPFTAHARAPFLTVDLDGALNAEHELDGPARFIATTERVSDIARESPFPLGAARLEGELRQARGTTAIQAALSGGEVEAFDQRTRLAGPVRAALTPERFQLTADLSAPDDAPALFSRARARAELSYDRKRRRFSLDRAAFDSAAASFDAQGRVIRGEGAFSGEWRVRRLEALAEGLTGGASGQWRAFSERHGEARVWTTTVQGAGADIAGSPTIISQLLGGAPRLDARLRYENHGITVSHARVDGAQMRAGATGRIVRGQADLSLEASARGPLTLGGAEISGAADATGRLSGRLARPALSARATLSSFSAAGVAIQQPVVTFTLAPGAHGYTGRGEAQGVVSGAALNASANVAVAGPALELTELDAQLAALQLRGEASIRPEGLDANLDVEGRLDGLAPGLSGGLAGELALTPQNMRFDAQLTDTHAGELRMRAATLRAHGPYDAIAAEFTMRGRLRRAPLVFEGTGTFDARGETGLTLEGRGTLADADIFTRAPIRARWSRGGLEASLDFAVGDGVMRAQWRERGRHVAGQAQIDDAPIAPIAAIWGERATGRIDGAVNLANDGRGLTGAADLWLADARFAGRQRARLNMRIIGDLDPARLRARVDASSADGLVARFEADAPVTTSVDPIRIALAREQRGRATWSMRGPAASLWAAARLPDQSLEGRVDGEGELSFGVGYLAGDGHIEIVDGRFEDKLTGVRLIDLNARVAFDDRGATIERFSASGPSGGRLTATGGSANPRRGLIAVALDNMRVADRPDARASASGQLALDWEDAHAVFRGNLDIVEADIDIASNPSAGIPTMDVIEINRPGEVDEAQDDEATGPNGSTELDVNISSPGRIFTRGRGVDAEWSLDLRLAGTRRRPLVYGEARAIRGTLALSGQPFEIEDARIVFNGDPLDAQVDLTAVRDTADLSARVRLTGTARDPEIAFTSDPPLPEDEILPQVLFGRSVEDLSAFEAAQLAGSIAALSGRTSLDLVGAARAAAGLDRFNIREDQEGGFLVAGGVYLTRDVYVEVARTGLGQAQTRAEWTLRPRLVLITSFLGNGDTSVSLRWRRESD